MCECSCTPVQGPVTWQCTKKNRCGGHWWVLRTEQNEGLWDDNWRDVPREHVHQCKCNQPGKQCCGQERREHNFAPAATIPSSTSVEADKGCDDKPPNGYSFQTCASLGWSLSKAAGIKLSAVTVGGESCRVCVALQNSLCALRQKKEIKIKCRCHHERL